MEMSGDLGFGFDTSAWRVTVRVLRVGRLGGSIKITPVWGLLGFFTLLGPGRCLDSKTPRQKPTALGRCPDGKMTEVYCIRCGNEARLATSWTSQNPDRRFFNCPSQKCPWIGWYDPEMCKPSKEIIPGLLKRSDRFQAEVKKLS